MSINVWLHGQRVTYDYNTISSQTVLQGRSTMSRNRTLNFLKQKSSKPSQLSLFSFANLHAVRHAVNKFMLVILLNGLPTKLRFICQQDKLCLSESNNVLSESDILTFSTVFTLRCDLAYFIVLWSLELNWYWILFPLHLNNVGSSWRSLLISLNCSSAASSATN